MAKSTITPRKRSPNPKLIARIEKIREILADVKITLEARMLMMEIHRYDGSYCAYCTHHNTGGACGHTCPLLCPADKGGAVFRITQNWYTLFRAEEASYREIVDDMDARGYEVYAATVSRWERTVEKLRLSGRTESERHADLNWRGIKPINYRAGIDMSWNFEERWGKGPGLDDQIAPDNPCRDSKRSFTDDGDEFVPKRVKRT